MKLIAGHSPKVIVIKVMGAPLLLIISSMTTMNAYGLPTYEDADLGIKLEYPSSWREGISTTSKENCSKIIHFCTVEFTPIGTTWYPDFVSFTIFKDMGIERCDCNNLTDFLRFQHEELLENSGSGVQFVNDNQTAIGKGNYSAWLIQYDKSFDSESVHHEAILINWVAQVDDSFYEFNFQADIGEDFSRYYPDVKSMLDSVEFLSNLPLSTKTESDKIPSFVSGYNSSRGLVG
ncbi:MAG: hypothetical protein ACRD8Z_01295 [Nitrososphaeraceae archaeon]